MLALDQALSFGEENSDLFDMRYAAILELTLLGWKNANALAVRHYFRVREDFYNDAIPKNRFIEAIVCLGAVGNSQAAFVLALQLGLINSVTERTGAFDSEVTMAIIQALGNIGASAAFNHLLNVDHLSYPNYIKIAAREALDRLKW